MPMDDNEKKELVKKIMEQRRAMWSGEAVSDHKPRKTSQTSRQNDPTASIPNTIKASNEIPVNITDEDVFGDIKDISDKGKPKPSKESKLEKDGEYSFKIIFSAVSILIIALLTGIVLGYILTILDFSSKL